jgi:hypothetical protein
MRRLLLLLPLALLAGCHARKAPPDGGYLEPGQWTADLTVDSMDNPDLSPDMVDAFKKRFEIHRSKCLTPEDSKTPDRLLFGRPDGCDYSRQEMANGRISATMNCEIPMARQTIQLDGEYQRQRYKLHVNGMVEERGGGRTVSYVATLIAKRVGDCSSDARPSGGLVP